MLNLIVSLNYKVVISQLTLQPRGYVLYFHQLFLSFFFSSSFFTSWTHCWATFWVLPCLASAAWRPFFHSYKMECIRIHFFLIFIYLFSKAPAGWGKWFDILNYSHVPAVVSTKGYLLLNMRVLLAIVLGQWFLFYGLTVFPTPPK